nr:MAG TPA: hypothetical protein [Caudoviricetes sp.]DAU23158.1 MAG TPA: hypothetical protein [Caudoviricetes sp.]
MRRQIAHCVLFLHYKLAERRQRKNYGKIRRLLN